MLSKLPSLNIIIHGESIFKDINNIVNHNPSLSTKDINYKDASQFKEEKSGWNYILIQNNYTEKTFETIKDILSNHYNYKYKISFFDNNNKEMISEKKILLDVLIFIVDKLEDEKSKQIYEDFQSYTKLKSKLPFIIYLTKEESNPDIETYFDLECTGSTFDRRNLYAFKFPTSNEDREIIYNKLKYFYYYYNTLGFIESDKINTLNIMIVGQAGAGKSTLQNLLQGEKIAREGEGASITYKISFYTDSRFNITKIDCPGFENDTTVKYVSKKIKDLITDMDKAKDHLDCIIYILKSSSERVLYEIDERIIKDILKYNDLEIIFCSNTFGMEEDSEEFLKNKEIIEDNLDSLIRTIDNFPNDKKKRILDNIVYANLVQKMKKNGQVSVNCYGIDKLLSALYKIMKDKKISITEIQNCKSIEELLQIAKKYPLLNLFKEKKDFIIKNRISLSKYILSCAKGDWWKDLFIFGLFTLDSRRKK